MTEPEFDDSTEYADEEGSEAVEWHDLPPERDFFASPYDPPVKTLVQEIREKELIARPTFQRNQVWDNARKSKFVESILLNIPIPTLFFAEDDDKTKVVVDGQQRLLALKDYVENAFKLRGLEVLHQLNKKKFEDLSERQQRIIKNRTLRCLVISASSDSEIRFQVFERLNQGGMPLNAQEVRHCVYRGTLNDLLHQLTDNAEWLKLYGRDEHHPRMVDCELVLRFFAVRAALPNYTPPLKKLLNDYMRDSRNPGKGAVEALSNLFLNSVRNVDSVFGDHPLRRVIGEGAQVKYDKSINRAVFDIQMLVLGMIDRDWLVANRDAVRSKFEDLCLNDEKFADCVSRATADKSRFEYRMSKWGESLTAMGAEFEPPDLVPNASSV